MALETALGGLAVTVGLIGCITDIRTRRVPNVLTLGAVVAALLVRGYFAGWLGVFSGVLGWLVGLMVLLPLFAMRGLGGGDVKLLAAFGAFVGVSTVLWTTAFGTIAGGVFAIILATRHHVWRRTWANVGLLLTHWRINGPVAVAGMTLEDSQSVRLAYAIPLTVGLVAALALGK